MATLACIGGMMANEHPYVTEVVQLLARMSMAPKPVDPYLIWGLLTLFRYFRRTDRWITVIIECESSIDDLEAATKHLTWLVIPPVYTGVTNEVPPNAARFCTARIELDQNEPHPWLRIFVLFFIPEIKRFEIAQPVNTDLNVEPRVINAEKPSPFVGLIDDFINFAHPELKNKGCRRVHSIWSQDLTSPHSASGEWTRPVDMGYGFECYSDTSKAYPPVLRRTTHGSHVASIAAGTHVKPDAADKTNGIPNTRDAVSTARILGVHLPLGTVVDTSGGSMSAQVLDGLRYIIRRTGSGSFGAVNVSYATHAGPHDGQSLLEAAVDELVQLCKGRLAVVFPVGNQYEARCHARFTLRPQSSQRLRWHVLPDSTTPSFIEIWFPKDVADAVGIELRSPSGEKSELVRIGGAWWPPAPPGIMHCALIFLRQVANGGDGTMALVAVAPTARRSSNSNAAPHGIWSVTVRNLERTGIKECIDAWVERNDSLFGRYVRGRQSYFVDRHYVPNGRKPQQPSDNEKAYVKREGSFSTFATGAQTIGVGGYTGRKSATSEVADYSAGGWTLTRRRDGTDVLARSDELAALPGLRGSGVNAVSVVRMNGTSVAAPQVTRLIANWMHLNGGHLTTEEILYRLWEATGFPLAVGMIPRPYPLEPIPVFFPRKDRRTGYGELPFPAQPTN